MQKYKPSRRINYFPEFFLFFVIHILGFLGLILFPLNGNLLLLFIFMAILPGIGITIGYHRCLAHRAFEFKYKWLERFFVTIGAMGSQHGPIWWSSIHRIHHQYSDTPYDPHDSRKGFWYAHFLWLGYVDKRWKNYKDIEGYDDSVRDISTDPYYRWLDKYFFLPSLPLYLILFFLGGWSWIFWGRIIPLIYHWHVTWMVNSVSHKFGYKSFDTGSNDQSRNNWLVGILALGEGWHNNHHAFPSSSKHGFFKWWEFDFTYLCILFLKKLGLVHHLRTTPLSKIKSTEQSPSFV